MRSKYQGIILISAAIISSCSGLAIPTTTNVANAQKVNGEAAIPAAAASIPSKTETDQPSKDAASTSSKEPRNGGQTSSSASLFDIKNGITSALNTHLGNLDQSQLGGLGALGLGLGFGLAKAKSATSGGDTYGVSDSYGTTRTKALSELKARLVDVVPDQGMGRIARFFLGSGTNINDLQDQYGVNNGNKGTQNLLNLDLNAQEIEEVNEQFRKD